MVASDERLVPYLPRLTLQWLRDRPSDRYQQIEGTLVFADLSGFTAMSERLAVLGREGAERLTEVIDATFATLLTGAYAEGGRLVSFGGDAMVLLFGDDDHLERGARAATGLRRALRGVGRQQTPRGVVHLRISIGVHSGVFTALLVGEFHRQLLLVGKGVTAVVDAEHAAASGQIVLSTAAAARLPGRCVGPEVAGGRRLVRAPAGSRTFPTHAPRTGLADVAGTGLARSIRDHLLEATGGAEHRVVTMGFVQVMGTDSAVSAGLHDAAMALEDVVSTVQRACERFDVTFLGADVDHDAVKLLLVAGAPSSHGDDEERMLLALRQVIDSALPLAVRAGVHRGNVYVGDVGPEYRRTFTVMGDTVNLAARLMAHADAGTILATHDVVDRSRTAFDVIEIEPFAARGKRDLVHAVTVGPQSTDASAAQVDQMIVGRDTELAILGAAWDQAASGRGGAVELVGEAGIGKTSLLDTFVERVRAPTLLRTRGDLYSASSPYHAARGLLLAALVGERAGQNDAAVVAVLRELVDTRAPKVRPWLPLLGDVLGVSIPATTEATQLADEHRRDKLHDVVAAGFDAALSGATLFAIEDTHWLDDASAALLAHLVDSATTRPWLLVTTRRDLGTGYVQAVDVGEVVRPAPLDVTAAALMAAPTGDQSRLPPVLMARLTEQAGGNPLFLRELIAAARSDPELDALPDSLDALLTARLDRLGPRDRDLVRRAAVLGARFRTRDLVLVAEDTTTVLGPSACARVADFVAPVDAETFGFTHALLRDAAYDTLPFRLRRELHGKVADSWSASQFSDEALLSYHLFAAGRWADAWEVSRRSGEAAVRAYAPVEAATLFDRALRAARHLGDAVPWSERAEVALLLARAHERSGSLEAAERSYAGVTAGSTDPLLKARALVQQAWLAERQGRLRLGARRARAARHLVELLDVGRPGRGECLGDALTAEGTCWMVAGDNDRAVSSLSRAVVVAEAAGDRRTVAHAGSILGWSQAMTGDDAAGATLERSLQIFEELGNLVGQATCLTNLGAVAYLRGDWRAAVAFYEQGQVAQLRSGDITGAALGAANIGEVLSDQGHWDDALTRLDEALDAWRATGHRHGVAYAQGLRGRLLARQGRHEHAAVELAAAEALHREVGATADATLVRLWSVECRTLAGEPQVALQLLDAGADDGSITASRLRGTAWWLSGGQSAAVELLQDSFQRATADANLYEQVCLAEVLNVVDPQVAPETASIRNNLGVIRLAVLPDRLRMAAGTDLRVVVRGEEQDA
jgi:class 3 adenylate cyclase/tetratricopeptide (TPR) repeat protein